MRIFIMENYEELSRVAAEFVESQVRLKPNSVLGLATGSTPEGMYASLVKNYKEGKSDYSGVTTFNLDEYFGIDETNPQSYNYFMHYHFLDHVNIDRKNINLPPGRTDSPEAVAKAYDEKIASYGGVDMQVLGVGPNGHIGFNEPGDFFVPETRKVELSETTIKANARFFESEDLVPKAAITMGMKSIMGAKTILFMASGKAKADAVYGVVKGPITPKLQGSILQLHKDVIVVVDKEAASKL